MIIWNHNLIAVSDIVRETGKELRAFGIVIREVFVGIIIRSALRDTKGGK